MTWNNRAQATISALLRPTQVIAVSVTYDPGWTATANGERVPNTRDGIGLMTLRPACDGPCQIHLSFEGGLERSLCRAASGLTLALVFLIAMFKISRQLLSLKVRKRKAAFQM